MASKPCWFLAPRGCPANGPIKLGNIVASPDSVDDPLFDSDSIPQSTNIFTYHEHNFIFRNQNTNSGALGILASFLQLVLGIGSDASFNWADTNGQKITACKMTSRWFNPTQDFVESRAKEADVRNYIVSSNFINKVYMIMGVMIASEATIAKTSADNKGGAVNVGVDATSLGLPLSVGAKNELQNEHQIEIESASMDDFVFAYRLKELKIKNNGKVVQRPFKKGALLDGNRLDDEYEQMVKEKKEEEEAARIKVEGLNGSDVSGTEFGMRVKQTFSEGSEEECFVVIG